MPFNIEGMSNNHENSMNKGLNRPGFLPNIDLAPRKEDPTFSLIEKQEEANELLAQIAENTLVLKELVIINRETQLNTEELTYVMRAIYDVAKADSKEEADGFLKKALAVINDSGEAVGNISNLISLLMGIYNTVNTMI